MEFKKVNTYTEFVDLKEQWNGLLDKINDSEIFYKWEWMNCYLQYYDKSLQSKLNIIVGYEKDEIIAIFPFVVKDDALGFITENTTDYNMVYVHRKYNKYDMVHKGLKYALQDEIVKKAVFLNMPSTSELFVILDAFRNLNWNAYLEESIVVPRLIRGDNEKTKYQKKQIKDIERRKRKLENEHKVQVQISQKIEKSVWEFVKQHHKKKYSDSIFNRSNVVEFYEQLVKSMENNIEISKLIVDDQIVAVHFGFKDDHKIYYYIPVYDDTYANKGVGIILLNEMINYYSRDMEFDFLKGNEAYKYYWSDNMRMNFHLLAYKKGKVNRIAKLILSLKNIKFIRKVLGR